MSTDTLPESTELTEREKRTGALQISFVIPLFNQVELTRECLSSLEATVPQEINYEVLFVDDGSTDGTPDFLKTLAQTHYRVITHTRNLGYACANNSGARQARGEFLCLLNNDLRLTPGWLEPMLKAFQQGDRIGIVGNVQRAVSNGTIDHVGMRIDLKGKPEHIRPVEKDLSRFRRYLECSCITGACMLIRRKLFLDLGGFDELFVNGCEDVDLCFRASKQNWRIISALKSVVWHHVSASRKTSLQNEHNTRYLFSKWRNELCREGALLWPQSYRTQLKNRDQSFSLKLYLEALLFLLGFRKEPPPPGIAIVRHQMLMVEKHWLEILGPNIHEPHMTKPKFSLRSSFFRPFSYNGFFLSPNPGEAAWIKEFGSVNVPETVSVDSIVVSGRVAPPDPKDSTTQGNLGLRVSINDLHHKKTSQIREGAFRVELPGAVPQSGRGTSINLRPLGVTIPNALAFLGRKTAKIPLINILLRRLQAYRPQRKNQRLIIERVQVNGEDLLDFSRPSSPLVVDFVLNRMQLGINFVGWFRAELGVAESVRYAVKAADAAHVPSALVDCKLNCLAAQGDTTMLHRLQESNPYPINVFHIDAAQAGDIDHHHGDNFRKDRYNIAYWAWELPEFPDHWIRYFQYFDEVWTPSRFVTEAISRKSPVPVLTMPHAIDFPIPTGNLRAKFGLPEKEFLFMFMYDLNSYQERKNPRAVIEAFRKAFPNGQSGAGLVMKVHGIRGNEKDFELLKESTSDITNCHLIPHTLPRSDVYALEAACDCFVSLHRSEGFGLGVAEAMFLGKPVISTDWSATAEFVNSENGCPVNYSIVQLSTNHGPYQKGQIWAHPNVDHAAWYMRKLLNDSEFRNRIAARGAQTIRQRFSPATIGALYQKRLQAIAQW